MASHQSGHGQANGHSKANAGGATAVPVSKRYSDIPSIVEIPIQGDPDDLPVVELNLEPLLDEPAELCTLFENENVARTYWMTVAIAYAKQNNIDHAIEMLMRGSSAIQGSNPKDKLGMMTGLCWMYLWKSREAPRFAFDASPNSDNSTKTKEHYLNQATQSLNEALRINPSYSPLTLARGVIYLLKASLVSPSKVAGPASIDPEKADLLRNALKCFDDALRVSNSRNMLALMGKARVLFSLAKYSEALNIYQEVLRKMPDMADPDPRLGIGCCFWQLGFKDDAKHAWDRCLEINPESKNANILVGLYYLDCTAKLPTNSPEFINLYKKAMTEYTQKSFKMDKNQPLICSTFANYFLSRKQLPNVESLANKALQYTDVNNIASDSWYLLARKEHFSENIEKATDYYRRADEARGGLERGYLPAKFGVAQLSVLNNDLGEAKLRLEKMIQQSKNYEAMILLGTLYAEEIFNNQHSASKEDKSAEMTKAIQYLETVRAAWKDPKKNQQPDASVLLNLARLYEVDHPDKALQCLLQVEQIELDQVPEMDRPSDLKDEVAMRNTLRRNLPPQLLNNIGCFYFQATKYDLASEMFEAALGACMRIEEKGEDVDTDALVTTISFNLGRSYESQSRIEDALAAYEKLIARHGDYTDAQARIAYIKLRNNPNKEGPDAVAKLYQENNSDVEVRALYGWFLGKVHARKRPANINEDAELRHYKHTLQHHDKHDRYALVGMGNLYMMAAREMRRETDQERQKRSAAYSRAVEFFDKALQLDPKNAYAAQGVAIALIEDRKEFSTALAILMKVRDTAKDVHVYVNLGHVFAELRQFSKAIENYEIALSKEGKQNDTTILACLGKVWLNKAKQGKDSDAYKTALEYAQKTLALAPEQVHFKFNVAFVQIQQVQHITGVPDQQRTLQQLEDASAGLEAAIETIDEIAKHPTPPYPKGDLEQRVSMARNTQRKQLAKQIEQQKVFEEKNKERMAAALEHRQAELRRREDERQQAMALQKERQDKIRKEREEIQARDLQRAKQRADEERVRQDAELTTDTETGEKVKRKRKTKLKTEGKPSKGRSRKKNKDGEDGTSATDEERQPKKKRRLASKKEDPKQYKSAEKVVDSDSDENDLEKAERALEENRGNGPHSDDDEDERSGGRNGNRNRDSGKGDQMEVDDDTAANLDDDDDDTAETTRRRARRGGRVLNDSDEDEELVDDDASEQEAETKKAPPRHRSPVDHSDEELDEQTAAGDTSMADVGNDEED